MGVALEMRGQTRSSEFFLSNITKEPIFQGFVKDVTHHGFCSHD